MDDRRIRDQSLSFFAKIVAGQGHEITNVLNIINELNGLLQDLMAGADRSHHVNLERVKAISEKVQYQVQRGETMIRQVRAFAHSADFPVTVFDLKTVLEQVVFLAERHTRLSKSELCPDFPEESTALQCSPFALQQAVFIAIDASLLTSTRPERIAVGYRIEQTRARLFVGTEVAFGGEPEAEKQLAFLDELLPELGGDLLEIPRTGQPYAVAFGLNRAAAPKADPTGPAEEQRGT